jgi:hypothetical protein
MWTYVLAAFFLIIGTLEIILGFHEPLRKAILESSPIRSRRAEPLVFLLIGAFALVTGLGIILYGAFW